MISQETIEEVKKRLVEVYNPITIYIFGSYAWGKPHDDSDLDLLIIVDESEERPQKRSIPGNKALWGLKVPRDLLVYTKEEFESRLVDNTTLPYRVKHEGKVLYARA